jgi:hypothetical protein
VWSVPKRWSISFSFAQQGFLRTAWNCSASVKPLEFQATFNPTDWREYHTITSTKLQKFAQKAISWSVRALLICALVAGGGAVLWFVLSSAADARAVQILAVQYLVVLAGTAGVYAALFTKINVHQMTYIFAFTDFGWRYYAHPARNSSDDIREWADIKGWKETKNYFHLKFAGKAAGKAPIHKRLWNLLTVPLGGLHLRAPKLEHAMIPKRVLNANQVSEVRSILTTLVRAPRGSGKVTV